MEMTRHFHHHPFGDRRAPFRFAPGHFLRLAMGGRGRHRGGGPFGGGGPGPFGGGGGGPRGGFPFPPFGPFGGGRFGHGPRVKRGDVRAGILALLAEGPRNGYQIIQELGSRSGGVWRPSPGSVYPALQQLEDEGLIRAEEVEGRRAFRLTDEGRAYVEARKEELAAPWATVAEGADSGAMEMMGLMGQVGMAAMQVVQAGNEAQTAEARQILANARRALYRLLAEDDPAGGGDTPAGEVGHA